MEIVRVERGKWEEKKSIVGIVIGIARVSHGGRWTDNQGWKNKGKETGSGTGNGLCLVRIIRSEMKFIRGGRPAQIVRIERGL